LLALIVAAAEPGAALAPHGVNLVDEDDARRVAFSLIEQIAYPRGADTHEHLDEFGTADAEEWHASLTGHGAGNVRLAGAGRADQQHALGDLRAQRLEALRVLEEGDNFLQFFFGFLHARHFREGNGRLIALEDSGLALAKREGLVIRALRLTHHEQQNAAKDQDGEEGAENGEQIAELAGLAHRYLDFVIRHSVVTQCLDNVHLVGLARGDAPIFDLGYQMVVRYDNTRILFIQRRILHGGHEFSQRDRSILAGFGSKQREDDSQDRDRNDQIDKAVLQPLTVHRCSSCVRRSEKADLNYGSLCSRHAHYTIPLCAPNCLHFLLAVIDPSVAGRRLECQA